MKDFTECVPSGILKTLLQLFNLGLIAVQHKLFVFWNCRISSTSCMSSWQKEKALCFTAFVSELCFLSYSGLIFFYVCQARSQTEPSVKKRFIF